MRDPPHAHVSTIEVLSWVHQDPGNTISQPQHTIAVPDAHRQDSAQKETWHCTAICDKTFDADPNLMQRRLCTTMGWVNGRLWTDRRGFNLRCNASSNSKE